MAEKIIADFGLPIKPTDKVKDLSVAYQQMVEIMKAYSRENLRVICFDEPSASLSDSEIDSLFSIIRKLRGEGKIVVYVSHRMSEIFKITDKVAVFKDGRYVDTVATGEVDERQLIRMMVGRDLGDVFRQLDRNRQPGDVLLEARDISSAYVDGVSFTLRAGEVLGFSGLVGAGRTETMRAIIGADRMTAGEVLLLGKRIRCRSPRDAMRHGIVLVPEDRKTQGILANLDVKGNINISLLREHSNRLGVLNERAEERAAEKGIRDFSIRTPSPRKKIVELSGGNQQKCVVARWMSTRPKVLILDEPTKGIDVGAKAEFYRMICEFTKQGLGVILISSELPEVIGLSDRIIVMRGRRISGELRREDAAEDRRGMAATAFTIPDTALEANLLHRPDRILGWVFDRDFYFTDLENKNAATRDKVSLKTTAPQPGNYDIEFWDLQTGEVIETKTCQVPDDSPDLTIDLPTFQRDVAFKIIARPIE